MTALSEALGYAGGVGLAGGLLGQLGDALSAPRRYAWRALGLPESGAELVSKLTGLDQDSWLAHGLGFGAELVGDPLTYAGGLLGGLSKTRAGKAAIGETGAILGDLANDTKSVWREALDDTPAVVMGQRQPRRGILQLPELDNRLEPPRVTPPLNMLPDIRADAAESASRAAELVPVQNQVWDDYLRSLKVDGEPLAELMESPDWWMRRNVDHDWVGDVASPEWGELFAGVKPDDMLEMINRRHEVFEQQKIAQFLDDSLARNSVVPRSVLDDVENALGQFREQSSHKVIGELANNLSGRLLHLPYSSASYPIAAERERLGQLSRMFYETLNRRAAAPVRSLSNMWEVMSPHEVSIFEDSGKITLSRAEQISAGISRMLDDAASQGYVLPYQSVHTLLESNPWFLARPFTARRGARFGNSGLA